jgi:hypothetical protein
MIVCNRVGKRFEPRRHYDHSDHAITLPLYCDQCDWGDIWVVTLAHTFGSSVPSRACSECDRECDRGWPQLWLLRMSQRL